MTNPLEMVYTGSLLIEGNAMQMIFANSPMPQSIVKSIFLAGPSPRSADVHDWRQDAVKYLREKNFDGTVLIPIPQEVFEGKPQNQGWNYINQIQWECQARKVADKIVFWVPRYIDRGMPGFTTNVEFGEDLHSGKMVYGRPDDAQKCRYLDQRAMHEKLAVFTSLEELLSTTVQELGQGSLRQNGEINVPLFIWQTDQFQSWYQSMKAVGNRLVDARLVSHFSIGSKVFSFSLWVNVWIESEQRFKSNETIFSRKDISTVVAYYKDATDTHVVLVSEFRSPVNNGSCMVIELPSGSTMASNHTPETNAQSELFEETGLMVADLARFEPVGSKQLVATLSTHKAQVYRVQLNKQEFEFIQEKVASKQAQGNTSETERTFVQLAKMSDLGSLDIDYSMMGMIFHALVSEGMKQH